MSMQQTQPGTVAGYTYEQVARAIDHSLLKPEMTDTEVMQGLELATKYDVASVCCRPCDVPVAASVLAGSSVKVGTTIGFSHGACTTATKVFEAQDAMANGAVELDMVLNIGHLRSRHFDDVRSDIGAVVKAGGDRAIVKVILENAYLSDELKREGCKAAAAAGAHFVKTSTGFAPSGATVEDLTLMRAAVPASVQVKAAGGIRTLDAMLAVLDIGVTRVGATATAAILEDFLERSASSAGASGERPEGEGY